LRAVETGGLRQPARATTGRSIRLTATARRVQNAANRRVSLLLVPFFPVNLAPAFTSIPLRTFVLASTT